jgi:glycosyltransferase involved in cell wall biosynthesis
LEHAREQGAWKPTWTAIPNFIDTDRFRPGTDSGLKRELNVPLNSPVVLTVAAIKRHHKRIDYLLEEFALLLAKWQEPAPTLVVAGGRTGDTQELMAHGEKSLGDRVRFLVNFSRERMPEVYRAADVFVLSSLFEMMPIAILEATASGLPCLVNKHPVLEWIVEAGGMTLDLSRRGALATGLWEVLASSSHRSQLGACARAHCQATFGTDRVVAQILDYYRFVAARNRRPAGACV